MTAKHDVAIELMKLLRPLLCVLVVTTVTAEDRYAPRNYQPPEFAFAENHLQVPFLPAARDWERVDIYVPKDATEPKLPCVILYYGGGWGGKAAGFKSSIEPLLKRGFVVAVPDYVLGAQQPVPLAIWDGAAAVRFLRAHAAKYRIDPERIGGWGFSAGGWLVQYLCPSDAATLFTVTSRDPRTKMVFPMLEPRPAHGECSAKMQAFATDWGAGKIGKSGGVLGHWITADDPPMFTCHNERDQLPAGAQVYRQAGAVVEVQYLDVRNTHVPNGNTPALDKAGQPSTWLETNVQFFEEYLKRPQAATAPEIFPAGGPITDPTTVRLTTVHRDARIHYTLDGGMPTASAPAYTAPVTVKPGTTLAAIAIKPGLPPSRVTSVTFTAGTVAAPVIMTTNASYTAKAGEPFTVTLAARCDKPVRWYLAGKVVLPDAAKSTHDPAWLKLDPQTGALAGTPTEPGVSVFIVAANVKDGENILVDAMSLTVVVSKGSAPSISRSGVLKPIAR